MIDLIQLKSTLKKLNSHQQQELIKKLYIDEEIESYQICLSFDKLSTFDKVHTFNLLLEKSENKIKQETINLFTKNLNKTYLFEFDNILSKNLTPKAKKFFAKQPIESFIFFNETFPITIYTHKLAILSFAQEEDKTDNILHFINKNTEFPILKTFFEQTTINFFNKEVWNPLFNSKPEEFFIDQTSPKYQKLIKQLFFIFNKQTTDIKINQEDIQANAQKNIDGIIKQNKYINFSNIILTTLLAYTLNNKFSDGNEKKDIPKKINKI